MGHYDDCWESYGEREERLSVSFRKEIDEELDKMCARELEAMSRMARNCEAMMTFASLVRNL